MECPYCVSEIDDKAHVCPQCSRDLYLLKPLLEKVAALEAGAATALATHADVNVAELQERIATLEAQLVAAGGAISTEVATPISTLRQLAVYWVPPLVLLLIAHALLIVVYDTNTLYLRIASLLIPLPFGYALMRRNTQGFTTWLLAGFAMALLAVLGMSYVISRVDMVPALPASAQEWREFAEYAASIGFSYATGLLMGCMTFQRHHRQNEGFVVRAVKAFSKGKTNVERVHALAKRLNDIGGSIVAAGTTVISIYTGLKDFLGN